jgi:hypothetical protein
VVIPLLRFRGIYLSVAADRAVGILKLLLAGRVQVAITTLLVVIMSAYKLFQLLSWRLLAVVRQGLMEMGA